MTTLDQSDWFEVCLDQHLMSFRIMGREIVSDFAFHDLPSVNTTIARTSVMRSPNPFPDSGLLLEEILDEQTRKPIIQIFESPHSIKYWSAGIGEFLINSSGSQVWYHLSKIAKPGDVDNVLVGPILSLAFQLQGQVLLHASAIVIDGVAVAFSAPSGIGKSTLAASFGHVGYRILTDDILPVINSPTGGVNALHSLPKLKLWKDSLDAFCEDAQRYSVVTSGLDKRRIRLGKHFAEVASGTWPLAVVYFLEPHLDPRRAINISEIKPMAAALRIIGSMYMSATLRGERAEHALRAAVRMASKIKIKRVSYYRAYDELSTLRTAITADVRREVPG